MAWNEGWEQDIFNRNRPHYNVPSAGTARFPELILDERDPAWETRKAGSTTTPNTRQDRQLDRLALYTALGDQAKIDKINKILDKLNVSAKDRAALLEKYGSSDTALERMAATGAVGAARAAELKALMAKEESLSDLEKFGTNAKADVADQMAQESERLRTSLMGSLGPNFDPNSPAALAALGRVDAGRRDELTRGLRGVDQSVLQAREANRQIYDIGAISGALTQIGLIVEMKKLAKEQQDIQDAQTRGTVMGSPTAYAGQLMAGGNWSATDANANTSGVSFSNSLWASIQRAMTMYKMFSRTGGGSQDLNHPTSPSPPSTMGGYQYGLEGLQSRNDPGAGYTNNFYY